MAAALSPERVLTNLTRGRKARPQKVSYPNLTLMPQTESYPNLTLNDKNKY